MTPGSQEDIFHTVYSGAKKFRYGIKNLIDCVSKIDPVFADVMQKRFDFAYQCVLDAPTPENLQKFLNVWLNGDLKQKIFEVSEEAILKEISKFKE